MENVWDHFGNWWAVALWVIMYGVFLAFVPFQKQSQRKPTNVYAAFIVASSLEMFGVPMSMYVVTQLFGHSLPEGILWGHTLIGRIGYWGKYMGAATGIAGAALVVLGWRDIYRHYWSRDTGRGHLVTSGIYARVRHPWYTGFLLLTLGMIAEWATIPLLLMWPVLAVIYCRLARKEEQDMEAEFGEEYLFYKRRIPMFIPALIVR